MEGAELAAVIAGADAHRAMFRPELHDRREAGPHCFGDSAFRQPVDNDFEDAADILVETCHHRPAQGRAIGVIGRGHHGFVFGADLGARPHDAAGERHNDALDAVHRRDREFRRAHGGLGGRAHDAEDCRRRPPFW